MNRAVVFSLMLSLAISLALTLVFITANNFKQTTIEQQAIEWLDNPRNLLEFSLKSEAGEFNNQSLAGRWTIVLFGFLSCADICPTSLMQLSKLAATLAEIPTQNEMNFVFISLDPERDSLAEVNQFVKYFDSSFLGITGNEEQLTRLTKILGIQFKVSADEDNYTIAHSIKFSIIDPKGVFRGRFSPGFNVPSLVRSFTAKLN